MAEIGLSRRHKLSHHYLSTPIINQSGTHAPVSPGSGSSGSGYSYLSQSDLSSSTGYSSQRSSGSSRSRWRSPTPSVSPREVSLITSSFSSLRSSCWVCPGLVTLVTRDAMDSASLVSREPLVPVLLLNMGGSRAREKRSVDLVLADRRTGLAILRDKLDTLSNYRSEGGEAVHRWHYSRDHSVVLGLVWLSAHLARQFLRRVQELMDIPENVGLSGPAKTRGPGVKKIKETEKRRRMTDKSEISSPCGFQHHASLSLEEWTQMTGLQ